MFLFVGVRVCALWLGFVGRVCGCSSVGYRGDCLLLVAGASLVVLYERCPGRFLR